MTTIYYGHIMDTPESPFTGGELRAETAALAVTDGRIVLRGGLNDAEAAFPGAEVVRFDGLLIPGMVDTHVHYPQLPVVGGLGMPLLQWLDECALPQEVRLADNDHARDLAGRFLGGLASAGTTSALVFGSHYATAMHTFFDAAASSGLRITSGVVVSDRNLREELHTSRRRREEMAGSSTPGTAGKPATPSPAVSLFRLGGDARGVRRAFASAGVCFLPRQARKGSKWLNCSPPPLHRHHDAFGLLTDHSVLATMYQMPS